MFNSPEITTTRCLLRKYEEADREEFADLFTDKEINRYMGGKVESRDEAYALFDKVFGIYNGDLLPRRFEIWAIRIGGCYAGHFELKQTDMTEEAELEIVYMLRKEYWGKGIMPEVIQEVRRYASESGMMLIATANPENENSLRALQKAGAEPGTYYNHEDGGGLKIRLKPHKD